MYFSLHTQPTREILLIVLNPFCLPELTSHISHQARKFTFRFTLGDSLWFCVSVVILQMAVMLYSWRQIPREGRIKVTRPVIPASSFIAFFQQSAYSRNNPLGADQICKLQLPQSLAMSCDRERVCHKEEENEMPPFVSRSNLVLQSQVYVDVAL